MPKEHYRQSYLRAKTEIRPLYTILTPHGAVNSRSPLVSLIFPSSKDKIRIFEDECKKRNTSAKTANASMFVKASEMDKIVEEEAKKKGNRSFLD